MNQELRKQEFKDRINLLAKTIYQFEGRSKDVSERVKQVDRMVYDAIIDVLKQFVIDRNFEGKKPEWLVSSVHTRLETGHTDDVIYLPRNEPKNHQVMFDTLKNYDIVPEDSQINDYDFLFDFASQKA
jgi:hypothetical protein